MVKFVGLFFVFCAASSGVFAESPVEQSQKSYGSPPSLGVRSLGGGYRGVNSGHGPVQQAIELDPNALMQGQRHYAQALYPQPQTQQFLSSPYALPGQGLPSYGGVVQAPKNYQTAVTQTKAVTKVPQALRLEQFQGGPPISFNAIGQGNNKPAYPVQYLPQFENPGVIYGRPIEGPGGQGPEGPLEFGPGPYEFSPEEAGPAFFPGHAQQAPSFYPGQALQLGPSRPVQYAKEAGHNVYSGQIIGHAYPKEAYPAHALSQHSHAKESCHSQYAPPALLKEVASYRPSPSVVREVGHYPPAIFKGHGGLPFYARGFSRHPEFM